MKNKNIQVDSEILFYAFRYALGRSTYAPITVIENIKYNIDSISETDMQLYIKEIDECHDYGMVIDQTDWLNFRLYLADKLASNTKL